MFVPWLFHLIRIAPAAKKTSAGRGWVLRLLRGIFLWRVRFSLRSLLLLAAGLSAGIGASLRYEENPWQVTWRWGPPQDLTVDRVQLAPDGQRMAMLFRPPHDPVEGPQFPIVLLFDRSGATPEVVYRAGSLSPELIFDTRSRLRVADGNALVDADSGETLLKWDTNETLAGVSEDGRTALTSSNDVCGIDPKKALCAAWDVDSGTKRFELPAGNYWLTGPHCTPAGTVALALCCAPDFVKTEENPERTNAAFPPYRPSTRFAAWDLETGTVVQTFDHAEPVDAAVLSHDGRSLLAGGACSMVLWDVANHRPVRRIRIDGSLKSAALGLDGTRAVLSTTQAGNWRYPLGLSPTVAAVRRLPVLDLPRDRPVAEVSLFASANFFLDSYYIEFSYPDGELHSEYQVPEFTPDGERLVAFNKEYAPAVLDARSGKELCLLQHPRLNGRNCTESPAVAAAAETVLLHDTRAVYRFERQRPEYWWRIFWLPESWLAALFAAGLSVSLLRDGRMKKS